MDKNCHLFATTAATIITGLGCFLAVLFLLFVCIMFFDQIQCIIENTSTVDSLKKKNNLVTEDDRSEASYSRTWWQNIKEVFGEDFGIGWIYPLDLPKELIVEREFD